MGERGIDGRRQSRQQPRCTKWSGYLLTAHEVHIPVPSSTYMMGQKVDCLSTSDSSEGGGGTAKRDIGRGGGRARWGTYEAGVITPTLGVLSLHDRIVKARRCGYCSKVSTYKIMRVDEQSPVRLSDALC